MPPNNFHPRTPAPTETVELRGRVRCHLANITTNSPTRHHYREMLEHELITIFGGFSATPLIGGWRDDDRERFVIEHGTTYEVTYSKSTHPDGERTLRNIFLRAARAIGEKFAYIEFNEVRVLIARVRPDTEEHDAHV